VSGPDNERHGHSFSHSHVFNLVNKSYELYKVTIPFLNESEHLLTLFKNRLIVSFFFLVFFYECSYKHFADGCQGSGLYECGVILRTGKDWPAARHLIDPLHWEAGG
jgi:hypothetical protein